MYRQPVELAMEERPSPSRIELLTGSARGPTWRRSAFIVALLACRWGRGGGSGHRGDLLRGLD